MEADAGVAAQDFARSHAGDLKIDALVLLNGFLQRKYRPGLVECARKAAIKPKRSLKHPLGYLPEGVHDCEDLDNNPVFPIPVLTVGGELDGVVRMARIVEASYTQQGIASLPVIVIEGMNHGALVDNSPIP